MRTILSAAAAAIALAAVPAVASAQGAAQANTQARVPPATTTVTPGGPEGAVITTNNPGNLTPPPASAMNKTYPVCTRGMTDNCQNAGEGGAPGRSRALNYWPGEPASDRRALR